TFGAGFVRPPCAVACECACHRPGANITGITALNGLIGTKWLGLFHDLLPSATRFGVLSITLTTENGPDGTRVEMKELLATIALLCLSNTVLAHDIYSNLRDRAGHLCCNGQDCRPVQVRVLPNGSYYLPRTNETIPADRATPSPDDRFHHCTYPAIENDVDGGPAWGKVTRCFFAPMHFS